MFRLFGRSLIGQYQLARRSLSLQEYHSKLLLREHNCNVQKFFVVDSAESADREFAQHDYKEYAVKSQLLAGGRGKGRFIGGPSDFSGVQITKNKNIALKAVKKMLGKRLVTKQTTDSGVLIRKVLVADSVPIHRETYLAIVLDRESNSPMIVASSNGGVDIEETAEKHPELIIKEVIDFEKGITTEQCFKIAQALKFNSLLRRKAATEIKQLYDLFVKLDADQIEINPFVESSEDRVFCIDAKINIDDNAKFRQTKIFEAAALESECEDERESRALECGLNCVGLDGDIACLVNGAGLAMATMDIIKLYGGEPANFLDVGGSVTENQVLEAFQIITSDKKVNSVLVNIFGGIVDCVIIARGIVGAVAKADLQVPLIVRLEGTNAIEARKLLARSGLKMRSCANLDEAAETAVKAAEACRNARTN